MVVTWWMVAFCPVLAVECMSILIILQFTEMGYMFDAHALCIECESERS